MSKERLQHAVFTPKVIADESREIDKAAHTDSRLYAEIGARWIYLSQAERANIIANLYRIGSPAIHCPHFAALIVTAERGEQHIKP